MRDFKLKIKLIFLILTNKYTASTKWKCWYMWDKEDKILISFDKEKRNNWEIHNV